MEMKIGVIKGDGIGPEIVDEAMKVLDRIAEVYGHSISYTQLLMGGASMMPCLWDPSAGMRRRPPGISLSRQNVRRQGFWPSERG